MRSSTPTRPLNAVVSERHAARFRSSCPTNGLADTYARIHAGLSRHRKPLATMDVLIAATALLHDAALLTANEAHFARVPSLRVLGYR